MEIGVIGLNEYTRNLCKYWTRRGHNLIFADLQNSANHYGFVAELGPNAIFDALPKVVQRAEIIVLAVPFRFLVSTLDLIEVQHKIVIDLVLEENPSVHSEDTSFNIIQRALPDAKVVKVTSRYPYYLYHLDSSDAETLYSYSKDDLAQRTVHLFIDGSGYRLIDLRMRQPGKQNFIL